MHAALFCYTLVIMFHTGSTKCVRAKSCANEIETSQHPHLPPKQTQGIRLISGPREWGNLFVRSSRGLRFNLCLGMVGKFNQKYQVSNFYVGGEGQKPLTAVNMCLEEMV